MGKHFEKAKQTYFPNSHHLTAKAVPDSPLARVAFYTPKEWAFVEIYQQKRNSKPSRLTLSVFSALCGVVFLFFMVH